MIVVLTLPIICRETKCEVHMRLRPRLDAPPYPGLLIMWRPGEIEFRVDQVVVDASLAKIVNRYMAWSKPLLLKTDAEFQDRVATLRLYGWEKGVV